MDVIAPPILFEGNKIQVWQMTATMIMSAGYGRLHMTT